MMLRTVKPVLKDTLIKWTTFISITCTIFSWHKDNMCSKTCFTDHIVNKDNLHIPISEYLHLKVTRPQ